MIIICLLLLNIFFINSTYTPYTPYNSLRGGNGNGNGNKNTTIYIPQNSLKSYNFRDENKTTISTLNNSLFYDFIYFNYLK